MEMNGARRLTGILLLVLALAGPLAACVTSPDDGASDVAANELYKEGRAAIRHGDYDAAIDLLSRLTTRYPYSRVVEPARLQLAFAFYKSGQAEEAIERLEQFIQRYPDSQNLAYAYYLRALAALEISSAELTDYMGRAPVTGALNSSRRSFQYLSQLAQKFPRSRYFDDAVKKIGELRDAMARYEIHAANYFLKEGHFEQALDRAEYVTRYYARSPQLPDALVIMVRAWLELGQQQKALEALQALETNYADLPVTREARRRFDATAGTD